MTLFQFEMSFSYANFERYFDIEGEVISSSRKTKMFTCEREDVSKLNFLISCASGFNIKLS